ncbi:MAG: hypothetical protein H0X36_14655 [Sphingomonadaceae bacterium]|nr:hypothetical protein [Sphingomonadaceae bacterium]
MDRSGLEIETGQWVQERRWTLSVHRGSLSVSHVVRRMRVDGTGGDQDRQRIPRALFWAVPLLTSAGIASALPVARPGANIPNGVTIALGEPERVTKARIALAHFVRRRNPVVQDPEPSFAAPPALAGPANATNAPVSLDSALLTAMTRGEFQPWSDSARGVGGLVVVGPIEANGEARCRNVVVMTRRWDAPNENAASVRCLDRDGALLPAATETAMVTPTGIEPVFQP